MSAASHTVPTGFSGVPPPGPATPVIATPMSAATGAGMFGERARDRLAHCAVRDEITFRDLEHLAFHLVRVRDHSAEYDIARAGDRREARAEQSAGAALGNGQRQPARSALLEHDRGEVGVPIGVNRSTDTLTYPSRRSLQQLVGFIRRVAPRGETQIDSVG